MREFDLFIPLYYNDGRPIDPGIFRIIQNQLLKRFEGLTFFPQPNKGFWKMGEVVFHDEIVIFRVITPKARSARRFLGKLKKQLMVDLQQEDILIVEREVGIL